MIFCLLALYVAKVQATMAQLNLNFTHVMLAHTCFTHVKVYNMECIFFLHTDL